MQKELVFIGLGRMGLAMTTHLVEREFIVHGFDVDEDSRQNASDAGVVKNNSISEAINNMIGRKIVWLMVPSEFVDGVLNEVLSELKPGDIVIDGGNSFFKDSIRREAELSKLKLHYIDCGTSGGMEGARHGASIMVGGHKEPVREVTNIFEALATKDGFAHVGGPGAGHFVKMVHNGIEYGMMGAIAEGLSFVEEQQVDLSIDIKQVLKPYKNGSIITSNLMGWMADSYKTEGYLNNIAGEVPKGETEFEMEFIVEEGKTPILSAALKQRKSTRGNPSRIGTLISAMRNQFGGHKTIKNK
ncbi:MAG: 6-phosphogluconate dehydrogenase [Candidatus Paceibacteria bacterium]|jgi:6-phosphogluconate dehydrogenase